MHTIFSNKSTNQFTDYTVISTNEDRRVIFIQFDYGVNTIYPWQRREFYNCASFRDAMGKLRLKWNLPLIFLPLFFKCLITSVAVSNCVLENSKKVSITLFI